jgi:iron complex outermembrane receptor protein
MNTERLMRLGTILLASSTLPTWAGAPAPDTPMLLAAHDTPRLEELRVEGHQRERTVSQVAPSTEITAAELESINLSTIEDAVSYEPNLVVRRRFIGDANGTLGIRGANMFQNARTLVYADGLPLHYHLQTRWSGAPRWSLVAPDEVESVEVLYGPFSAVYPGNAMGGVVRISTRMPEAREIKLRGALFNQFYEQLATEETYSGGRFSASYGNSLGDFGVLGFYSHLQNEGQPMTQFFAEPEALEAPAVGSGGIRGENAAGDPVVYYGDSGAEDSRTGLLKLRTTYQRGDYHLRTTLAYEQRSGSNDTPNTYVSDSDGNPVWQGATLLDEQTYVIKGANFSERAQERRSLLVGAGLTGPLTDDWSLDINASHFQVIEDIEKRSARNPADSVFDGSGRITTYDDTGWTTLDLSASTDRFAGHNTMVMTVGGHYSHYSLGIRSYDSGGEKSSLRSASGGETLTQALFAEYAWHFAAQWDLTLGARYEHWQASEGYVGQQSHPERSASGISPKLSLGYAPSTSWELRYAVARALRFPLVEELYQNVSRATSIQTANVQLEPEDGLHHNFLVERLLGNGYARVNLFQETVDDVVFNQLGIVDGTEISTFLGIDEVVTRGAEFILSQPGIAQSKLDIRFNLSYLDAEITENRVNPAVEGKQFPRLPQWQFNLLLTYNLNSRFTASSGLRYASNSFGELDNSDSASRTFGAHDSYLFLNLKAAWEATDKLKLAVGMDNVTNETAFVHHPWPSRTLYLEAGYDL